MQKYYLILKVLKNKVLIIPKIKSINYQFYNCICCSKNCIFLFFTFAKDLSVPPEKPKINPVVNGGVDLFFILFHCVFYGRGTRLLKPMKAMARIPAVTSAMGTPFMPLGVPVSSSCSRMPAKMTSARVKPTAMEAE